MDPLISGKRLEMFEIPALICSKVPPALIAAAAEPPTAAVVLVAEVVAVVALKKGKQINVNKQLIDNYAHEHLLEIFVYYFHLPKNGL